MYGQTLYQMTSYLDLYCLSMSHQKIKERRANVTLESDLQVNNSNVLKSGRRERSCSVVEC